MQIWGKLVGSAIGLATGRPWFALLGLFLGHQFDRGFAERPAPEQGEQSNPLPESLVRAIFQLAGHIAKADGRVTAAEIRATRALMNSLNLSPAQVRRAIDWFDAGKDPQFAVSATLKRARRDTETSPTVRPLLARMLVGVALSKGRISGGERRLLRRICGELGIGPVAFAQLEASVRARQAFGKSPSSAPDSKRVRDAYDVLGLKPDCSDDEIKQAYRRLMNRHHPDKIAASSPDAEAVAAAEQRTRSIRAAWDVLKTRRLIR